ncbi:signal recognition particle receptor subunit beta-like [Plakobranchus ocellatus]|uniref:ADP-ribosylation factor-related protein 1 n=1 Tax=Plakobranchus ocellatus TaxID=259542 RepID=A0AAV3Z7D8_9GAST|nr:signal recognition particle receptor subunit beta-like [Plakobranchus ocellatus]
MADINAYVQQLHYGMRNRDPLILGILVAIFVGFITLLLLIIRSRGKNKRQGVLLLGVCDAGKTLIYSQLVNNNYKQTYTSVTPNSGEYVVTQKNKKLRVIDLPGHERLRGQMLDEYKTLARALVFVIDSGTLQKDIKEVAEYLYTVLSDKALSSQAPPILVLCNKQDLTLAKGAKVVRSQLEKEINTLRITRAASLQSVGDTGTSNTSFLGRRDKDFNFSDLKPLRVEFAECSARGKDKISNCPNLEELHQWLSNVA